MRSRRVGMAGTLAVLLLGMMSTGSALAAAVLKGDFRFQGSRASSVSGAPALKDIGPGVNVFATETVDGSTRRVLRFPKANGVALKPTTGLIPNDRWTVVVLFRFEEISGWRRIVDFSDATSDSGLYSYNGRLNFYPAVYAVETDVDVNEWVQVALTRTAAGIITGYVDGLKRFTFSDTAGKGVINDLKGLRFFRDNEITGPTTEHSAGAVSRIRVWNDALTDAQVAALGEFPARQRLVPTPDSGPQGSSVSVKGTNFGPGEVVTVRLRDANGMVITLGTATTNAAGGFMRSFTIPAAAVNGAARISGRGGTSMLAANVAFTVT